MNADTARHSRFLEARLLFHDMVERCDKLGRPELKCLRVIRVETLDRGFPQVLIPSLEYFAERTGLHLSEVSRAIDALVLKRIIQAPEKVKKGERKPRRPGGWYGINVLFGAWNATIEPEFPRALGLQPSYPDLNDALRMNFVEFGGAEPPLPAAVTGVSRDVRPGGVPSTRLTAPTPERTGVPPAGLSTGVPPAIVKIPIAVGECNLPTHPVITVVRRVTELQGVDELQHSQSGTVITAPGIGKIPIESPGRPRVTWSMQRALLSRVESWTGPEDIARSGDSFWVPKAIRNFPDSVSAAVEKMFDLERSGYRFADGQHRVRKLMVTLAQMAGVKSWAGIRPGPEPEEQ